MKLLLTIVALAIVGVLAYWFISWIVSLGLTIVIVGVVVYYLFGRKRKNA